MWCLLQKRSGTKSSGSEFFIGAALFQSAKFQGQLHGEREFGVPDLKLKKFPTEKLAKG